MSTTKSGLTDVRVYPDGGFSVMVPGDPAVTERRNEAIRLLAQEQEEEWEKVRQALPHRSERQPHRFAAQERERQERSLGRLGDRQGGLGGTTERHWLHPMGDDVYLHSLACQLVELEPRLSAMRAEMLARPEEFKGRVFDLGVFRDSGWGLQDELSREMLVEESVAAFVAWVGAPNSQRGMAASRMVLMGLGSWSDRSRWVFGTWSRWPWFAWQDG